MERTIRQRVSDFCKSQRISQREFERRIGAANGFVNSISKGIGAEKMSTIRKVFPALNPTWLLYGEGEMLQSPTANVATIDTNIGTFNQGTNVNMGDSSEEKGLYKKIVDLLEQQVKQLKEEKEAFLRRHGCASYDEIDKKIESLK